MTRKHAVVLGGSIAGLLAARVLADVYERVIVVDRDDIGPVVHTDPRRGVPQGRHVHGLLASGLRAIEELLPGSTAEMVAAGVPSGDVLGSVRWCPNGSVLRQVDIGERGLGPARPYLESYVRSRVLALPNISLRAGTDVVGLDVSRLPAGRTGSRDTAWRVVGAKVQARTPGSVEEVIPADLVVDATGRGSRTPRWLVELGYEPPVEETLAIDIAYVSRHYRVPADRMGGDLAIIVGPTVSQPRSAVVQMATGGRVMVTLCGILGDQPPTDDDGMIAFAKTLPLPDVFDALDGAEPADEPVRYRFPASVRHRYERLSRFPDGLLVIGDAICSFNPMYGQGMSVSAVQARVLARELARGLHWRRFFAAVKPVVDTPWQIAVGADLAFPGVQGRRTPMVRFVNAYVARLHRAAAHDAVLAAAFIKVANLLKRPPSLLRPDLALRVLVHGAGGANATDGRR